MQIDKYTQMSIDTQFHVFYLKNGLSVCDLRLLCPLIKRVTARLFIHKERSKSRGVL